MESRLFAYHIGALLYCPANHTTIAQSIITERFGKQYSLALCLEDTISDNCVEEAEKILIKSLSKIHSESKHADFFIPKIFIRVRHPKQIVRLFSSIGTAAKLITGFILPKFSLENADAYLAEILAVNQLSKTKLYMMPIFESPTMIDLRNRTTILYALKEKLDAVKDYVLNIRVGGNDFCHMFGFRRHHCESIHQIRPIANIFSDIITVYGMDYVISGPVWEYFHGDWEQGLRNEIAEDKLCGFIGKTVIHPNQIPIINEMYQVSRQDFDDAASILDWDPNTNSLVSSSNTKERMNEYKTHFNWAKKTLMLAEVYGIKESVQ